MSERNPGRTPFLPQLTLFLLMLVAAGLLATSAYTRGASGTVEFTCDDGDRFVVEYLEGYVRLRHGSGVFALSRDEVLGPDSSTYSDGSLTFRADGQSATLALPGTETRRSCMVEDTSI